MIDHDKNVGAILAALDELGIADNTFVMYSTDNGPHVNSWPDGAMTPFRSEKNTNWEGAYRVPAMFRWPGKIKPGQVSNEAVAHLDMLPTLLAIAGDTQVKDKLLPRLQDRRYDLQGPLGRRYLGGYLTGQSPKSPRELFFTSMTINSWSGCGTTTGSWFSWSSARPEHSLFGPIRSRICGSRKCLISEQTRMSARTSLQIPITIGFLTTPSLLVPAQDYVGQFLMTFRDYPQRQKAASFNLDEVLTKLRESSGSK